MDRKKIPTFGPAAAARKGVYETDTEVFSGPDANVVYSESNRTAASAPFAYSFKNAEGGNAALKKLHSYALHSDTSATTNNSDVPLKALRPKVFASHSRTEGSSLLPRSVAVERKRQEYALIAEGPKRTSLPELKTSDQDLGGFHSLLAEEGIDFTLPGGLVPNTPLAIDMDIIGIEFDGTDKITFPLELFDDTDFETLSPQDWVSLGIDDGEDSFLSQGTAVKQRRPGVPAKALCVIKEQQALTSPVFTPTGHWRDCRVLHYLEGIGRYLVAWISSPLPEGSEEPSLTLQALSSISSGLMSSSPESLCRDVPSVRGFSLVHPLYVCPTSQSPLLFVARLKSALQLRAESLLRLRLSFTVDVMPTDGMSPLSPAALRRIEALSCRGRSVRQWMLQQEMNALPGIIDPGTLRATQINPVASSTSVQPFRRSLKSPRRSSSPSSPSKAGFLPSRSDESFSGTKDGIPHIPSPVKGQAFVAAAVPPLALLPLQHHLQLGLHELEGSAARAMNLLLFADILDKAEQGEPARPSDGAPHKQADENTAPATPSLPPLLQLFRVITSSFRSRVRSTAERANIMNNFYYMASEEVMRRLLANGPEPSSEAKRLSLSNINHPLNRNNKLPLYSRLATSDKNALFERSWLNPPCMGRVPVPPFKFTLQMQAFAFLSLLSREEIIKLLGRVRLELLRLEQSASASTASGSVSTAGTVSVAGSASGAGSGTSSSGRVGSIFNTVGSKSMRADEFEALHAASCNAFTSYLRETLVPALKASIKLNLSSIKKGSLHLGETDYKVFLGSKLFRLLKRVQLEMQDHVRGAVVEMVAQFCGSVQRVFEVFETPTSDPAVVSIKGLHPLFAVDVSIEDVPSSEDNSNSDSSDHSGDNSAQNSRNDALSSNSNRDSVRLVPSTPLETLAAAPLATLSRSLAALSSIPTLEKQIMEGIYFPEEIFPTITSMQDPLLEPYISSLRRNLDSAVAAPASVLESLRPFVLQLSTDYEGIVNRLSERFSEAPDAVSASEIEAILLQAQAAAARAQQEVPPRVFCALCVLNLTELRSALQRVHQQGVDLALALAHDACQSRCEAVLSTLDAISKRLNAPTPTIEAVAELREYLATIPAALSDLQPILASANSLAALCDKFCSSTRREAFETLWRARAGPFRIQQRADEVATSLDAAQLRFLEELGTNQSEFDLLLGSLSDDVAALASYTHAGQLADAHAHATRVRTLLQQAEQRARLLNSREAIFGRPLTDYGSVAATAAEFEPYWLLWDSIHQWEQKEQLWINGSLSELDSEQIEKDVQSLYRSLAKAAKTFDRQHLQQQEAAASAAAAAASMGQPVIVPSISSSPHPCSSLAQAIRGRIESFRSNLPLLTALLQEGLRERHWTEIHTETGLTVRPESEEFSLAAVLAQGGLTHVESLTRISERAAKEYQIESSLDLMQEQWAEVRLDLLAYRETGSFVLRGIDVLQALLDEQTSLVQALSFSVFKAPFADRIQTWSDSLMMVSEVLDSWIKVQRGWMYLEPIFSSGDIQKQLPVEYKKFSQVDRNWRQIMSSARGSTSASANPQGLTERAIQFCDSADILKKWREAERALDSVQKGLSDYLETKRAGFARFYFLSNDELLEILSQTKDPQAVQPHLKKCFEGVRAVTFDSNGCIDSLVSAEKEVIHLLKPLDPAGKNVETWMSELEAAMQAAVRKVMFSAIMDYSQQPRSSWMQAWPGQCVLNGSQLHWTSEIEAGIKTAGVEGVRKCYEQQLAQLLDIVVLIRGKLTPLARLTLGALTVIDVHARDVTKKLVENKVSSVAAFEWTSQMRYAWLGDGLDGGDLWVQMVSSVRPYGYEYLGNTPRLVITPLTDKCYMTIMSALQMNLGGAPAGPAGTGKTETTKDLAKALSMYCIVFNCSDGLDYLAMGKFFKGLASCGAWACFDEFNRIDVEVLSVVAQQILTLQDGVKAGVSKITFEGSNIPLNPRFAVFITMNPGYAGRSELPDNLKVLFRPVAMMVPDYALIGEIMLYSYGFERARPCAEKMVATFKLCSEQLSSQDHYDYGMRAVKSVITAAGALKAQFPDQEEEYLLYRALSDVNLPKFLAPDLVLFRGIMEDLFPSLNKAEVDRAELNAALAAAATQAVLQPSPFFLMKCVQLYEMVLVRHGLMLVGPTGGAKTSVLSCTAQALSNMHAQGIQGPRVQKVHCFTMNPKSITQGQLYGEFDENTHEWTDGVLAEIVRDASKSTTPDLKWVVFDGPVDAVWIENMNTVLDDNKKLCLVSGEIIALSNEMTIMFEVEDLAVASPATVSRCGMVYTEPVALGVQVLVDSWLQRMPTSVLTESIRAALLDLSETYLMPSLQFLRKNCVEVVKSTDSQLVGSFLNLLECAFQPFVENPTVDAVRTLARQLPAFFVFSLVWSVGATIDGPSRVRFSTFLTGILDSSAFPFQFPSGNAQTNAQLLPYGFLWDSAAAQWVPWLQTIPPYSVPSNAEYSEIIVPTNESVCVKYITKTLILQGHQVLVTGATGTGKSVNIAELLGSGLPKEYIPIQIGFSAQTSANQTQDFIDSKTEKRQRSTFGPPSGSRFIVHVDDLNMPQKEVYGAQPPIELLRQFLDFGGWYDRKERSFRRIIDTSLVCSMGPPGGGRYPITQRIVRHFNMLAINPLHKESMTTIFSTIMRAFYSSFPEQVQQTVDAVIDMTVGIYLSVCENLLPSPVKPHYTFNLRDISKVFQGILMAPSAVVCDQQVQVRLWAHEMNRVFSDRFVNDADKRWFSAQLNEWLQKTLPSVGSLDAVALPTHTSVNGAPRFLFGDFLPSNTAKHYAEIPDAVAAQAAVADFLNDYNAESSQGRSAMNLVMFTDAVEHVARISRIIRQPGGHALLVGVGGSGRQSLTRLASFVCDFSVFSVEISKGYGRAEWREDLKTAVKTAGVEEKQVVFLFSDTQVVFEGMLEDINNLLNSGDVPNLYAVEDLEDIATACRPECIKRGLVPSKLNIFSQYLLRVKRNIHLCLAMSPMSSSFRDRLRMFPSLVNCCTIDWFAEWPADALRSVANTKFKEFQLTFSSPGANAAPNDAESLESRVIEFLTRAHLSVARASERFKERMSRYNYVTPTSFLEMLISYRDILQRRRKDIDSLRNRLVTGIDKIKETEAKVGGLKIDLEVLQPILAETQVKVAEMIALIDVDKAAATVTKSKVEADEAVANKAAEECQRIADQANSALELEIPKLEEAMKKVGDIERSHIDSLKRFTNPPAVIVLVLKACMIMLGIKPKLVADPQNPSKKVKDYFSVAIAKMSDPLSFLRELLSYQSDPEKKEHIPQANLDEFAKEIRTHDDWTKDKVTAGASAVLGIYYWCNALYDYRIVSAEVEPLRQRLREATASLEVVTDRLNTVKAELRAVEERLAELEGALEQKNKEKEKLANDVMIADARLQAAHSLLSGLGGEKARWESTAEQLKLDFENLTGDVLIASTTVAYLGAFTAEFRDEVLQELQAALAELRIPHTPGARLSSVLNDPLQTRSWQIAGLPSDSFSLENSWIMTSSRRWSLFIDPQGQANQFVKNLGKDASVCPNGLEVLRPTEKKFLQSLENCIRFGKWALVENMPEYLEASLEPILLRQTFKQGGSLMIRLGDSSIPYSSDFRMFLTTTHPNPHYSPEDQVKVSLLNFTTTPSGLEDQLLGLFIVTELPQLETKKNELMLASVRGKKELQDMENRILHLLSSIQGNLLDDVELRDTLAVTKTKSAEINAAMKEAAVTERDIDITREQYRPVAARASLLYFTIASMGVVDHMYQYSLGWFNRLFVSSIRDSDAAEDAHARMQILNRHFTYAVYANVCRSLFEKDKLLFALLMTVRIMGGQGLVDERMFNFLISGGAVTSSNDCNPHLELENPAPEWMSERLWREALALSTVPGFGALAPSLVSDRTTLEAFWALFDSNEAHREPMPSAWAVSSLATTADRGCSIFMSEERSSSLGELVYGGTRGGSGNQRLLGLAYLCLLRFVRPDKLPQALTEFISTELGPEFVDPPPLSLQACFNDSSPTQPLLFVLTPGSDPTRIFYTFAESAGMRGRVDAISLGQGQGVVAARLIEDAATRGAWVLLQNCHLAVSWLPTLERIVDTLDPARVHRDFRLWLTSMPSPQFPLSLLQNGVKITNEPPKGLRSNIRAFFFQATDADLSLTRNPPVFRKLLFGLAFFHAVVQERKRFGALGWNRPYDFNDSDMEISLRQIALYIDEYEEVPYRVLHILTSYVNYGGRVTDDKDCRTIDVILRDYFTPKILEDEYKFSESGIFYAPTVDDVAPQQSFLQYVESLPVDAPPEVFGMHANANISCELAEADALMQTLVSMQPRKVAAPGQRPREEVIAETCQSILQQLPEKFDIDAIQEKFPVRYEDSMNTVLAQECVRYNKLTATVRASLTELTKAVKGLVVMSRDLELVSIALTQNRVPAAWEAVAYPSLKPLAQWIQDLVLRLEMLATWAATKQPAVFWISGFFFPQAFLTGTLQNYARKLRLPIDTLSFGPKFICNTPWTSIEAPPEDGCYIRGLFLEGARFDQDKGLLADSVPKQLFTQLPVIHLVPEQYRKPPTGGVYLCPVYKILSRWGVLATTGHSSNFIMFIEVPTDRGDIINNEGQADCGYWIKAGVAAFTQLRD